MKLIRIAASDWLETEFSVPIVQAMPQEGKEHHFNFRDRRAGLPFAGKIAGIARAEANTILSAPSA